MHDRKLLRAVLGFLYGHMFFLYWPLYRMYKSRADQRERAWITALVSPGDVIVDVGANVGVFSVFFAGLVGPTGSVFGFEPDPQNFARLRRTTARLPRVFPTEAAVGDVTGTIALFQSKGLNFDHRTYANADDVVSVEVAITRLDDVAALRDQPIRLVKIDVQGFEMAVLRGAQATLAANPDAKLLLEYYPWGLTAAGSSPTAFIDMLRSEGWVVTAFDADPDVLFDGIGRSGDRNWYRNLVIGRVADDHVQGLTRVSLEPR